MQLVHLKEHIVHGLVVVLLLLVGEVAAECVIVLLRQGHAILFTRLERVGGDFGGEVVGMQRTHDFAGDPVVVLDMISREGVVAAVAQHAPVQEVPLGVEVGFITGYGRSVEQEAIAAALGHGGDAAGTERGVVFDEVALVHHEHGDAGFDERQHLAGEAHAPGQALDAVDVDHRHVALAMLAQLPA